MKKEICKKLKSSPKKRDTSLRAQERGIYNCIRRDADIKELGCDACRSIANKLARGLRDFGRKGCVEASKEIVALNLGYKVKVKGRSRSITDNEVEKFYQYFIQASEIQTIESSKRKMLEYADVLKDLQKRRVRYKDSRKREAKIDKQMLKGSEKFVITALMKEIVDIVDFELKKKRYSERRYLDHSFKLVAVIFQSIADPSIAKFNWKRIKSSVNKSLPPMK